MVRDSTFKLLHPERSKYVNIASFPTSSDIFTRLSRSFKNKLQRDKAFSSAIVDVAYLQTLTLVKCKSLIEVSDEARKVATLTYLDLSACKSLKGLALAIGNALSL